MRRALEKLNPKGTSDVERTPHPRSRRRHHARTSAASGAAGAPHSAPSRGAPPLARPPAGTHPSVGRRRASWPRRATRALSSSPAGARRRCFCVEVIVMELLLIISLLVVFNLAATRWGFDSRDGFRVIRH